jgi:hypothetical protein
MLNQQNLDNQVAIDDLYQVPDDANPQVVEHDGMRIMRFPDGSHSFIPIEEESNPELNLDDHDQNLAMVLDESELRDIGYSLKQAIEEDKGSQEEWYQAISDVLELLGLDPTAGLDKDDLPFKGASTVYSPALFQSAIDILATAKKELFTKKMVDVVILGEANDQLRDIAYREKAFYNYYFNNVAKEYKKEALCAIFWAIIIGVSYKKVYIDPVLGRPVALYIQPQDFIINQQYACHYTASRKTHVIHLNERDLEIRRQMGIYKKKEILPQDTYTGEGESISERLNIIAGYEPAFQKDDPIYDVYECHVDYKLKGDPAGKEHDIPLPYIISLDKESGDILSIKRNWKKDDFLKQKRQFFVAWSFLPALKGEGYGLIHYAGSAAKAATSITRQLINTATYANFPGGVYQAGVRIENNNLRPSPGEFVPIFTAGAMSDAIMPLPYKEPSPTLHDLKNELEEAIRQPSAIINSKVADFNPQAPVGTTLAMLESLQKVPNCILQSFHESLTEELELFKERFIEWLPESTPYPFVVPGGEHSIMREDFLQGTAVIPSSDPSVQNSTYRFLQSEIILNNVRQDPDIHDKKFAYEYFYKNLGLSEDDIQKILPKTPEQPPVQPLDPISENQHIMIGQPVKAGIWQDHHAHMTVHQLLLQDPNTMAAAQAHIQEHLALQFLVEMQQQIGFEMPEDPSQLPPEEQNKIAIAAAHVAQEKLQNQEQAQQPQQMIDPAIPALEEVKVLAEKNHLEAETARMRIEFDHQKLESDAKLKEQELLLKENDNQQKVILDRMKLELEGMKQERDNALKERDMAIKESKQIAETHRENALSTQDTML